jgi:hypothetical protein
MATALGGSDYERANGVFHPDRASGKIMDRSKFAHSSELDSCTLIGVK